MPSDTHHIKPLKSKAWNPECTRMLRCTCIPYTSTRLKLLQPMFEQDWTTVFWWALIC